MRLVLIRYMARVSSAVLLTDGRLSVHTEEEQSLETLRCLHAAFLERQNNS